MDVLAFTVMRLAYSARLRNASVPHFCPCVMTEQRRVGWASSFGDFQDATPKHIREELAHFVTDASKEQVRAWDSSIPPLQAEVMKTLIRDGLAGQYSAILEYQLPMESRRPDVVLLLGGSVMVVELKGKRFATQADLDQASAYARDLRHYHRECATRDVTAVLVPTLASGYLEEVGGVHVTGPDALDSLVARITANAPSGLIDRTAFLADDAYCPLPTIVEAARELMQSGTLRKIHRASAATGPTLDEISRIVHVAAATSTRHLILVTGVPGAGKTLVGLQTVHAQYLDDLAVDRANGKPTAPAVFLSGNGPLVEVLQYEMRDVGDGRVFVRGVKDYVKRFSSNRSLVPPEHVLVFDEAQRAWDAAQVQAKHDGGPARSEPEEFISFADRVPDWCVVIGLVGTGQEIHIGEEGGLTQWRSAVEGSARRTEWTVHAPPAIADVFADGSVPLELRRDLHLSVEIRFHKAKEMSQFAARLLEGAPTAELRPIAERLEFDGLHLRITRDLEVAKEYLRDRYQGDPDARFGLLASSKDKALPNFGVSNDFQSTKRVKFGPWYGDDEEDYAGRSCRRLEACVTEFGAQGLELDAVLLAWGTDFAWKDNSWSVALAGGYREKYRIRDAHQLRLNSYRVLLTRGRDATVVYVPMLSVLDATYDRLVASGFRELHAAPA